MEATMSHLFAPQPLHLKAFKGRGVSVASDFFIKPLANISHVLKLRKRVISNLFFVSTFCYYKDPFVFFLNTDLHM